LLASSAQYFDDESEDPQQQQQMMVPRNNHHNNPNHTHTLPPLESTNSHHQVVDTVPADHPSSSIIQTSRTCSLCHRTLPRSQFSERDRFSINLSIAPGASCRTCAMTVSAVRLKGMPGTERLLADYARRGVARGMLLENGTVVPGTIGPNGVPIAGYLEGSDTNGMNSSDALVVRQPSGGVAGKELTLYGGGGGGMYGNDPNRNGANSNIMGMAPPPNNTDVNAAFSSGARPYGHSDADRSPRIADCKYIDSLLRMPSYLNLNAFGLFTSSGEASVSLAALEAVRLYGTLDESSFVPHDCEGMPVMDRVERKKKNKNNKKKNNNNDEEEGGETKDPTTSSSSDERETINPKSIVCLVLNEGPTPRTSVLASQHYGWTSLAIDPALSEDWDGYHDDIPNFTGYSGSISDYMDDAGEMLIEFRDQSVRHLVIIAMQCGAGGSGSGDALRLKGNAHIDDIRSRYEDVPTTLVSLSPVRRATLAPYRRRAGMCGSKLEKDVGYEPNCSYVDEGVFSEVRMVEVWNFHNADDDDDDDEEEEEVEGGTRRSHQSGGDYVPKKTIPLERRYSHESRAAGSSDYVVPPKKNHPSSVRQQPPPQGSKKREEQRKAKKKKKEEKHKKSGGGGGGRKKNNEWLEERVAQFKEKQQERGGGGDDGVDDGGGHANNNTNERDQQRQIVPQQEFAESFNTLSTKGTLERRDSDGDVLVRLPSEMGNDDGSDESKETSSPNGSDREQNHPDSENRRHHHHHREGGEELEVWSPPDEEVANQVWEKAMAKHGEQETLVNQLEEYYNIENENEADDNDDRQARQGDDVPTNNDPQHGLPPNWEAIHDPASGDYYYNNWETGEVTWDRPLGNHPPAIEDQVDDDDNDESSSSVASSNPPEAGAVGTGYEDGPYMDDEYSQQSTSTQSTTPSYNAFDHSKAANDTKTNIPNDSDDDGKEEDDAPPRYTGNSKLNNSRTSQSEEESEAYVFDDQSSASSGIAALSRWNEQTTDTTLGESHNADASQEEEDMIVWSSDEEEEEGEDRLGEIERTGSNSSSLSRKQPWHKRDSGEVPGSNHDSFIYD